MDEKYDLASFWQKRQLLSSQLNDAPDRLQGVLSIALSNLDSQIAQTLSQEDVQNEINQQKAQMQSDINQIEVLEESGLLSDEQVTQALRDIFNHDDYAYLRTAERLQSVIAPYAGGVALKASETVVVPIKEDSSDTAHVHEATDSFKDPETAESHEATEPQAKETVQERKPVHMTIFGNEDRKILRIGKDGKIIKLSDNAEHQRDYSIVRQAVLEKLIEAQGKEVRIAELRDVISELRTFDDISLKDIMGVTRSWLSKLSFRNQSLFEHNGKRGMGSAYRSNSAFELSLSIKNSEKPTSNQTTTDHSKGNIALREHSNPLNIEHAVSEGLIPLRESAVLLNFLNENGDLLQALGVPTPPKELVVAVDEASRIEDEKAGVLRTSVDTKQIDSERRKVAREFRAVFTNEEIFDSFVGNVSSTDPLMPLVDYLLTYDEQNWKDIVNQVLTAKITRSDLVVKNGKSNPLIEGTRELICLSNGRKFVRDFIDGKSTITESTRDIDTKNFVEDNENALGILAISETIDHKGVEIADSQTESIPGDKNETSTWVSDFRKETGRAIKQLQDLNIIIKEDEPMNLTKFRTLYMSNMKSGLPQFVKKLIDHGILPRSTARQNVDTITLTMRDAVSAVLIDSQPVLTGARGTTLQKQSFKILDECVRSFLDSLDKK